MPQVIQHKRSWRWLAWLGVGVAVAGGLWWSHVKQATPKSADGKDNASWSLWPSQMPNAAPTLGAAPMPGATPPEAVRDPSPLDTMQPPVFRADSKGDLVIDPQTKDDVERVYALYHGDEAQRKLVEFSARIPDKARRQLKDLYQNYSQYAQALAQAIPPAQDEVSIEDAKKQLDIMAKLQDEAFKDQAESLFGRDRKITRDMVNNMAANAGRNPNLSNEELADIAQKNQSTHAGGMPPGEQAGSGDGGFAGGVGGAGPLNQGAPKGPGR